MRYISKLFAINQKTIYSNTIDYARRFMKINLSEEEIKEGKFDEAPNILFTRKIPHLMFEYSQKIVKKISNFTVLPLAGYNYFTSKNNDTIEISQTILERMKEDHGFMYQRTLWTKRI
jgi:hypothetical protein